MTHKLKFKQEVSVHHLKKNDEYVMHGFYLDEDEEYIWIEGTVGDKIGRVMQFPKAQVLFLEYEERNKLRDSYDEHWEK